MFTKLDFYNARLYATEHLKKLKYEQFIISHPHIFNNVIVNERPATKQDYYVPPKIKSSCFVYELNFTKVGCEKVSCFPFKQNGEKCSITDPTQITEIGNQFTISCQRACVELYNEKMVLDTKFKNNTCKISNHYLKLYALKPYSRIDNLSLDIDDDNNNILLNDNYCKAHGLILRNKKCTTTTSQDIGEFFVGSVIYRTLNLVTNPPIIAPKQIPAIPDYLTTNWKSKIKRSTPNPIIHPMATGIEKLEIIKQVALELSIDLIIDISTNKVANILNKTIPIHMAENVSTTTLATIYKYRAIKFFGKTLSIVSGSVSAFGLGTLFLDYFDPLDFGKVLTQEQLNAISARCQILFNYNYPDILKPEMLFSILSGSESESTLLFVEEKVQEYLNSLDINSAGQRIQLQKEHLNSILESQRKKFPPFSKIFYFLITIIAMILSFTYLLPYVIVMYLLFAINYTFL